MSTGAVWRAVWEWSGWREKGEGRRGVLFGGESGVLLSGPEVVCVGARELYVIHVSREAETGICNGKATLSLRVA